MTAAIIRADARALPFPDASVDLIVTSPPYFALRSYQDGGTHYDAQIGAEGTPDEYLDALLGCTREWMRVLKSTGSLWVNLGDKYAGAPSGPQGKSSAFNERTGARHALRQKVRRSVRDKSLYGLPWRYALLCIDDLGLILRAEVIWAKPNGMPESVTDRVRRAHEHWFHFVKQPRYYAAVDEIREAHTGQDRGRGTGGYGGANGLRPHGFTSMRHQLGKLPGSVWEVPTQPLKVPAHLDVDHFAAFPMEFPRRIILGWSPPAICTRCRQGRRPLVEKTYLASAEDRKRRMGKVGTPDTTGLNPQGNGSGGRDMRATITGYACACPDATAATVPAIVLDPFGGTGTTALVADVHGRHAISSDMSADYCRLAAWRTTDPGERARALGVPKPPPVLDGQADLFEEAP